MSGPASASSACQRPCAAQIASRRVCFQASSSSHHSPQAFHSRFPSLRPLGTCVGACSKRTQGAPVLPARTQQTTSSHGRSLHSNSEAGAVPQCVTLRNEHQTALYFHGILPHFMANFGQKHRRRWTREPRTCMWSPNNPVPHCVARLTTSPHHTPTRHS